MRQVAEVVVLILIGFAGGVFTSGRVTTTIDALVSAIKALDSNLHLRLTAVEAALTKKS